MNGHNDKQEILAAFSSDMKRDWDWRARENAKWFINTFKLDQTDEEFDSTGWRDFAGQIQSDLMLLTGGRDPGSLRLLEIGCGVGRMTRHLAEVFGEVHAVDVSAEMIRQAKERFNGDHHLHFYETSGCDFAAFPNDYFDVIFSAYVFQHVPDPDVIESNLRDAFRVLKPGGIFKFVTNGITHPDLQRMPRDTWAGAVFSESDIRRLSLEIGAQLVGITGGDTQYCWSLMRKRLSHHLNHSATSIELPQIIACGRTDDPTNRELPARTGEVWLTLLATGINPEAVDTNNVTVELGERSLIPGYVGPVGAGFDEKVQGIIAQSASDLVQVNLRIPDDEPGGTPTVRVRLPDDSASNSVTIVLPPPQTTVPVIHLVTNVQDGGVDIFARGPKSRLRLFVRGLSSEINSEEITVQLEGRRIILESLVFLPSNGVWRITLQLPADTLPGESRVNIRVGEGVLPDVTLHLQ